MPPPPKKKKKKKKMECLDPLRISNSVRRATKPAYCETKTKQNMYRCEGRERECTLTKEFYVRARRPYIINGGGYTKTPSVRLLWAHGAIFRSSQCSTTGVTKAVVRANESMGWCI